MKYLLALLGMLAAFGCGMDAGNGERPVEAMPDRADKPRPQEGDLIFQTSLSSQSLAIQIATDSKYSHVGIVYKEGGELFVYEAVQPVRLAPLPEWIARGEGGAYVVKRLRADSILNEESVARMKVVGMEHLGKDYDLRFEWSDDKMYCSELVWKIYEEALGIRLGELRKIRDFDLSDKVVAAKLKERYGTAIPLDEPVITPQGLFEADALVTVLEGAGSY